MASITQLEYVVAVYKLRHFGRAAEQCHVSQPSLSVQVQKLEDELDIVIFDRSKKPIMATDRGENFVAQAKKVLNEYKRLKDIPKLKGEVEGDFHLAVIPTLSSYLLPLFLNAFASAYPKVNLKISEQKTEDIILNLYEDKIDAALMVTPLQDSRLIERVVFYEPFYAFLSKEHHLSKKNKISEDHLSPEDLWLLAEGHCFRDQVLKLCNIKKSRKILTNVHFESGNMETLKSFVRLGTGYTLLPELATYNLSKDEKRDCLRPFKNPVPTREVSLVHARSFLKEEIISVMLQKITEKIPKNLKALRRKQISVVDI